MPKKDSHNRLRLPMSERGEEEFEDTKGAISNQKPYIEEQQTTQ